MKLARLLKNFLFQYIVKINNTSGLQKNMYFTQTKWNTEK
jgi:hypothetical protein